MANITLLSDLGLQDASTGVVKGILYNAMPNARITDISHEVAPFDTAQAAYILGSVCQSFPTGTAHLVSVDVFYDARPKLILATADTQYLLAPDNGIIPAALGNTPFETWLVYEHTGDTTYEAWLHTAASIISRLQAQTPAEMGLQPYTPTHLQMQGRVDDSGAIVCRILYLDNFGNLVTDMTHGRFNELNRRGRFIVSVGVDTIDKISTFYTDVQKGEPLCRFNSRGYMEICVHKGNASALLGFRVGGIYNDIKISFE